MWKAKIVLECQARCYGDGVGDGYDELVHFTARGRLDGEWQGVVFVLV